MPYTTTPPGTATIREVAILSVDVVNHSATGMGRHSNNAVGVRNPLNQYFIDTSYYVGAAQVQPSVGEQWHITKINGQWRLHSRIPFNDPNQAIMPTQGQHIVGSGNGPVELSGTQINARGPLSLFAGNSPLPAANTAPVGSLAYNGTVPVYSDGMNWIPIGTSVPRVTTITSSATPTFSVDTTDLLSITAQAVAITSMTSGLSGTFHDGQKLSVRIHSAGSHAISWGADYVASGVAALPTTTVTNMTITTGLIYDTVKGAFVCMAADTAGY